MYSPQKTSVESRLNLSLIESALSHRLELGIPYVRVVARHLLRKKAKRGDKSQIVKNHEISAFSMCYHVFSKVVNKANSTVTDYYAHGNLKFSHY